MRKVIKYKLSWVKKNKYNVLCYTEDLDELFIDVVYAGNINECEIFLKEQRNASN